MTSTPPPDQAGIIRPRRRELGGAATAALILIAFAVVLFLLGQARFLLISLVTAIILFSLMSDAIDMIARLRVGPARIPTWLASLVALTLVSGLLLMLSALIVSQVNTVVTVTLSYADRSIAAIAGLFGWLGEDVEAAVLGAMRSVDISAYLRAAAGQAGGLLSASVLIIIFVTFLFVERIWFRAKLAALCGSPERAERTRRIIGTIMRRVNRYLLVKGAVSALTGAVIYLIARGFGLDLALPLAILTFVLNFIPSVGSIVATAMLGLVAWLQLGEPGPAITVFLLGGAAQFLLGNILDPMLMGRALQLSSFGIILSLAFWGAVWGIPGMFLSVPMMVAVMIVSAEMPGLRGLAVLLSRDGRPPSAPPGGAAAD
jgi:predicted PurR-regulated permease PerM